MNIVYWLLKNHCFEFFLGGEGGERGVENTVFFEPKSWWKYHTYWLLKSSCFELFRNGKYGVLWDKKLVKRSYLLITEMFLFWTFRGWKIRPLFEAKTRWYLLVTENFLFWAFPLWEIRFFWGKNVMETWYLLITEKFLFWATEKFLLWTFWWWEIRSFFSQKVDVKVIFTCSFWAFHDIPGPGKYCFLCSVSVN